MTVLAELTAATLLFPLALAPAPMAPVAVESTPAPMVVAPAGSTVVVTEGAPVVAAAPAPTTMLVNEWPESVSTTTTTTTTTTTATTTAAPSPTATPLPRALTPKEAVRNVLRYDPYLAPRYRSGRNMMIGGGVMMGVGGFTLLSTLSWMTLSHNLNAGATPDERRHAAYEHNRWVPTARVVGLVAAGVTLAGIVLLATGAVRRRRAIEEARGRVYMQAGPGGMQVRF